jgi:hypothetical protein
VKKLALPIGHLPIQSTDPVTLRGKLRARIPRFAAGPEQDAAGAVNRLVTEHASLSMGA